MIAFYGTATLSLEIYRVPTETGKKWKSWKMKMVIEKSCIVKDGQRVMEYCDQSWNFTNFETEFH